MYSRGNIFIACFVLSKSEPACSPVNVWSMRPILWLPFRNLRHPFSFTHLNKKSYSNIYNMSKELRKILWHSKLIIKLYFTCLQQSTQFPFLATNIHFDTSIHSLDARRRIHPFAGLSSSTKSQPWVICIVNWKRDFNFQNKLSMQKWIYLYYLRVVMIDFITTK